MMTNLALIVMESRFLERDGNGKQENGQQEITKPFAPKKT